ncbi:hypothetical protein K438DRAFT_1965891 [Mycena galopus ATCC 62051]|nr:hypothetical protein K438DRAFT_1965891 [Mycena galopus ATCC 62051]
MPTTPESLASPLSLLLFSFLDSVILAAYRLPHLPFDILPLLTGCSYLTVLTLAAAVFPLVMPRLYRPVDPKVRPRSFLPLRFPFSPHPSVCLTHPEQLASPLSRLLLSSLDPVTLAAYRLLPLPPDMLPLLADGDESAFCRRGVSR